jgi:hypothetical protein
MKTNEVKNYFTPIKISSKIPVDIKNVIPKDIRGKKSDSRENRHIVDIYQKNNLNNFPKINIGPLKNSQKTTSLRDILLKNIENIKSKNDNVSPSNSPRGEKKTVRASSNASKNTKICVEIEEKILQDSQSPERNLEKNKSVPPKHFNISLIYTKNKTHVRQFSEGQIDNPDSRNINERSVNKGTKTTKDSSFTSQKVNNTNLKGTHLEVESIEELHFIYNNLYQQNKVLAFKFENLEIDEDVLSHEDKTIYIN